VSLAEIAELRADPKPMDVKMRLGRMIAADFHSAEEAQRAQDEFTRVVRNRETPAEVEAVVLLAADLAGGKVRIDKLLARTGQAASVSEATRKIKAGAVKVDGVTVTELSLPIPDSPFMLQAGKQWRRVELTDALANINP
jgi:tyrosyl-tRNA synthetase